MNKKGHKNPNWRGGKTKTQHGYILVRVGTDHHLSDIRGYAYEHRVVAEKKMGRKLLPGEQVHHINGIRSDNSPENIKVIRDLAEHRFLHRKNESKLRKPDEPNEIIFCKCGCGGNFKKYDSTNRPREYVSGHNSQPASMECEILNILERGSLHRKRISQLCDKNITCVATALSKLKRKGLIKQISCGIWGLS